MWMSDKPLVQEELAGKIADLIHSFASGEAGMYNIMYRVLKRKKERKNNNNNNNKKNPSKNNNFI